MSKKINNEIRVEDIWQQDLQIVIDGEVILMIPLIDIIKSMDKQQLREMIDEFVAEHLEEYHYKIGQIQHSKFKINI